MRLFTAVTSTSKYGEMEVYHGMADSWVEFVSKCREKYISEHPHAKPTDIWVETMPAVKPIG